MNLCVMFLLSVCAAPAQSASDSDPAEDQADKKDNAGSPEKLYEYRQKGQRAMDDGIYSAAARFFKRYRKATDRQEPDFSDATILLVKAYLKEGQPANAQDALSYHQKNTPGLSDATYKEDLTYFKALTFARRHAWDKVIETVRPLSQEASDAYNKHRALRLLGKAYARTQQWEKAKSTLSKLLKTVPEGTENAAQTREELLKTYIAQGDLKMAEQIRKELQEKDENVPPAKIKLYELLINVKRGKLEAAYNLYQDISGNSPDQADSDWWMGLSELTDQLMAENQLEKALTVLETAESLTPTQEAQKHAQLQKAKILIQQEKIALAINALNEFEETFPESEEIITVKMQLGELLRETDNPLSAANYFKQVMKNKQANLSQRYRAAIRRGWSFNDAEKYGKARDNFLEAAELAEDDNKKAQGLLYAADAEDRQGKHQSAAELYKKIAENLSGTAQAETARYKQALSYVKQKKYAKASKLFSTYLEEFPKGKRVVTVRLEYGISLKEAEKYDQALKQLKKFLKQEPEHEKAPRALFAAYEIALERENPDTAIEFLSRIIEDYPDSDFSRKALYTRAHTRFIYNRNKKAISDSKLFLNKYPNVPRAAEILLWLGDHFANRGDLKTGRKHFLQLVNEHPDSAFAPTALYEAAESNYRLEEYDAALALVKQLNDQYPECSDRTAAKAALLKGDIAANRADYSDAVPSFRKAWKLAPQTPDGRAGYGRLGDMYFSMASTSSEADEQEDYHKKALECFSKLSKIEDISSRLRHKAFYRKAKTLEKMDRTEAAIRNYLDLIYGYEVENRDKKKLADWYYIERAGFDVCDLLIQQERLREAARIYERLARFGTPASEEAAQRGAELRETHNLDG